MYNKIVLKSTEIGLKLLIENTVINTKNLGDDQNSIILVNLRNLQLIICKYHQRFRKFHHFL